MLLSLVTRDRFPSLSHPAHGVIFPGTCQGSSNHKLPVFSDFRTLFTLLPSQFRCNSSAFNGIRTLLKTTEGVPTCQSTYWSSRSTQKELTFFFHGPIGFQETAAGRAGGLCRGQGSTVNSLLLVPVPDLPP